MKSLDSLAVEEASLREREVRGVSGVRIEIEICVWLAPCLLPFSSQSPILPAHQSFFSFFPPSNTKKDFLERRRLSYMKRIDPSSSPEDDDDDDDEDEEEEEESQGEKENEAENKNPQIQAVVSEKDDEEALGSIAVLDGPSEQKKHEIKTFLEQELPEIQKNVAVRARMLWFKWKEYDDKLVDTRGKLAEVKGLIAELEHGLPPLNSEGGIALVPSV